MKNFDQFIGIDWSGAKAPIHTPSIAVAACTQGSAAPTLIRSQSNRNNWSRKDVFEYIQSISERTLIGIDANFGYSEIIGVSQFGKSYDYNDLWHAVEKHSLQNTLPQDRGVASSKAAKVGGDFKKHNFFAGGFWESYPEYFWTHGKMPPHMQFPKRQTEQLCSAQGYGNPESPFKLIGAKQVGKGGLAAMRMAHALKQTLGDQICIWPFESHIEDTAKIVITEIFPRQFLMRTGHGTTKVNTIDELNKALKNLKCKNKYETMRFNNNDADAIVSAAGLRMLCGNRKTIPLALSNPPQMNAAAKTREGWIFGV